MKPRTYKHTENRYRVIIPQDSDEYSSIDCNKLFNEIEKNYKKSKAPANVILTWSTVRDVACDDIKVVTDF